VATATPPGTRGCVRSSPPTCVASAQSTPSQTRSLSAREWHRASDWSCVLWPARRWPEHELQVGDHLVRPPGIRGSRPRQGQAAEVLRQAKRGRQGHDCAPVRPRPAGRLLQRSEPAIAGNG
jgi:hypothetical protein